MYIVFYSTQPFNPELLTLHEDYGDSVDPVMKGVTIKKELTICSHWMEKMSGKQTKDNDKRQKGRRRFGM